jgi:hypothetical protein
MLDKDLVINSTIEHLSNVGSSLFGVKLGVASKGLAKVVLSNFLDNSKYGVYVNMLFDKNGNFLCEAKDYFDAMKEFISQKPLEICGVRFSSKDIDSIQKIFEGLK